MPNNMPKQPWESQVREVAGKAEEELRRLVTYLNDDVMPEVRRNGSEALRRAAAEMHKLAERMDDARKTTPPPPPK